MPLTVIDQPYCLLSNPIDEVLTTADDDVPLEFANTEHNVGGCTVNAAKSRITVPVTGTYLISALASGQKTNAGESGDGIGFELFKNGSAPINSNAFPLQTFGQNDGDEWSFSFCIPLPLAASDYLEVVLTNVNSSAGTLKYGYFSVTKLH